MVLAKPLLLRLLREKQRAKCVRAQLPVTTLAMIALSQAARFARAGFSSVRDGRRCWPRCGANKGPTART